MKEESHDQKETPKEEYQKFESEAQQLLAENERNIARLKSVEPPDQESEQMHEYFFFYRKLQAIEQKNADLKSQLTDNKFDKDWRLFIVHFKNYMSDLMLAFKSFVTKG